MEAFLAHHHAGDVGPPPAWGGVADDGPDAPCAVAGMFGELTADCSGKLIEWPKNPCTVTRQTENLSIFIRAKVI